VLPARAFSRLQVLEMASIWSHAAVHQPLPSTGQGHGRPRVVSTIARRQGRDEGLRPKARGGSEPWPSGGRTRGHQPGCG
jgi:hypothetical protein